MTNRHTFLVAACAILALSAASDARAQSAPSVTETGADLDALSAILGEMTVRLEPLAGSLGLEVTDLMREVEPMVRAALPTPPAGDAKWAYSFDFRNDTVVTSGGSATGERQAILADAEACAARYPLAGPVVHFRRIRRDGLVGHQCVLMTYEDSMGLLISETYAEGPDRHMAARYSAAATLEDGSDAARALFEPVLDSNIDLAVELADLALESAVRAVAASSD
jgi:hypothetical protein